MLALAAITFCMQDWWPIVFSMHLLFKKDNCILTNGGWHQQHGNLRSTEIYNPNSGEVFQGPNLLTGRRLFSTAWIGTDSYVAGGVSSVNHREMSISSCEMLSEGHFNWSPIGQMRNARSAFGMAAAEGKLYAFGRVDHHDCPLHSVEYYSPEHKTWNLCEPMVFSRTHHAVAKLNNWIYICGGKYGHCSWDLVTCDRFNWVTGDWEQIASMNLVIQLLFSSQFQMVCMLLVAGKMKQSNRWKCT